MPDEPLRVYWDANVEVADFHTYDEKLHRHSNAFPFHVREPFTQQPQLPGT